MGVAKIKAIPATSTVAEMAHAALVRRFILYPSNAGA